MGARARSGPELLVDELGLGPRAILDEVLQFRPDFIEHQLAHAVKDPNGRAYNRTAHLADRKKMMQTWSDYLYGLKKGVKVIPFRAKSGSTSGR
jgi:hypothetical protein